MATMQSPRLQDGEVRQKLGVVVNAGGEGFLWIRTDEDRMVELKVRVTRTGEGFKVVQDPGVELRYEVLNITDVTLRRRRGRSADRPGSAHNPMNETGGGILLSEGPMEPVATAAATARVNANADAPPANECMELLRDMHGRLMLQEMRMSHLSELVAAQSTRSVATKDRAAPEEEPEERSTTAMDARRILSTPNLLLDMTPESYRILQLQIVHLLGPATASNKEWLADTANTLQAQAVSIGMIADHLKSKKKIPLKELVVIGRITAKMIDLTEMRAHGAHPTSIAHRARAHDFVRNNHPDIPDYMAEVATEAGRISKNEPKSPRRP